MALWTLADLGSVNKAEFWAGDVSTSGSNITQANDQSGNGNHAVQATSNAQPTYSATGVNSSYPSMEFDASNDWLDFTLASGSPSQPITFILIGEWRGGSNWANVWRDINGNGPVVYKNNTGSNFSMYGGSAEIQDSTHFTSGPVVIVAHFDGANSFLSVNGNRSSKSNAGTDGCAARMSIGGVPVSGSWFGGGINRCAVLVGQSLDASGDSTLDKIEGFGAWTIGNAASLPGGHAYKSAAPTTGIDGTISYTEANDSASASGTVTDSGTISYTEADDTVSVAGTVTIGGAISYTEGNDTTSVSGSVGGGVTGSIAYTEADDTIAAQGTITNRGSITYTEDGDSTSVQIAVPVTANIAYTEDDDTTAIVGTAGTVYGSNPGGGGGGGAAEPIDWREKRKFDQDLEKTIRAKLRQLMPAAETEEVEEVVEQVVEQAARVPKVVLRRNRIAEIDALIANVRREIEMERDDEEALMALL